MSKLYDEEFIKFQTENMNIVNKAFNIHLKQVQNQKAIECLKEVREYISKGLEYDYDVQVWFEEYIDNKIKELDEE